MKQLYDADYIIRKNNEYEELRIYNSPVEVKLRAMIAENNRRLAEQNEKLKAQKAKLEAARASRHSAEEEAVEMGMGM